MCGRFTITVTAGLGERFGVSGADCRIEPRYNVAPSQEIPLIRDGHERRLGFLEWGLPVSWQSGRLINARAESVLEKPIFRPLVRAGRCLVPADGFFEWDRRGGEFVPWYFRCEEGDLFAFAGLAGEDGCLIVTTPANPDVAPVHDRMPVILRREDEERWLSPGLPDREEIRELCAPLPAGALVRHRVSLRVNDPRTDDPSLLAFVPGDHQQTLTGLDPQDG
ncbi:MAG: SOS response-associated peptidase [Methanomicrobiales archaeon]